MASGVSITELRILLGAEIQPLIDGMNQAKKEVQNFEKDAQRVAESVLTPYQRYAVESTRIRKLAEERPDIVTPHVLAMAIDNLKKKYQE